MADRNPGRELARIAADRSFTIRERLAAVAELSTFGRQERARWLLMAFRKCGKEESIAFECARWLGLTRLKAVEDGLLRVLENSSDDQTIRTAAYALGIFRSRRAAPTLRTILQNRERQPRTRGYCAEALAHVPSKRNAAVLLSCLNDAASEVRYWSIFALAEMKETEALPLLRVLANSDHQTVESGKTVADEARWAIRRMRRHK
jgi:HEAT repeat protein